jgi:GcrA cell cycle regulator
VYPEFVKHKKHGGYNIQGGKPMIWDQATIHELKTLHARGIDYVEIGRRVGRSKGAIAGKVDRLELKQRPPPIIEGPYNGAPTSHRGVITTEEQEWRILLMTELSDRKCAEVIGVSRYVVNRVRRPQREAARAALAALPTLASLSAPLPKPVVVVFQKVATISDTGRPILPTEERNRRILAMGNVSQSQCAKALGISHHAVRYVREKHRGTAPEATARAAQSPCVAVAAASQYRAPTPDQPSPAPTIYRRQATSCCWPTGERTSVYHTHRFCGCAEVVPGKPYCAEHVARAYVRVRYDRAEL